MSTPSENTVQAWARLVRAHRVAFTGVEKALKEGGHPPLSWYDVLLELERHPDGLRLFELEQHLLLPQYNVSRLIDRLENERLVLKSTDEQDGRGRLLKITKKGQGLRAHMWPTYAKAIQTYIGDPLTSSEVKRLSSLLAKLVER